MSWKFDRSVASHFVDYARKHIPDYDAVIDKCIEVANVNLARSAKILDFGSATGHTLEKFKEAGFNNLYGIDNSKDMLANCKLHLAKYYNLDSIPSYMKDFDLIMANWTLQFIKDKTSILTQMYATLKVGGMLVVTEKVTEDQLMLDMYHEWKTKQGVSKEEIKQKHESLKDVLMIESDEWWHNNLKAAGFNRINVINANWCFNTYLCVKE